MSTKREAEEQFKRIMKEPSSKNPKRQTMTIGEMIDEANRVAKALGLTKKQAGELRVWVGYMIDANLKECQTFFRT